MTGYYWDWSMIFLSLIIFRESLIIFTLKSNYEEFLLKNEKKCCLKIEIHKVKTGCLNNNENLDYPSRNDYI